MDRFKWLQQSWEYLNTRILENDRFLAMFSLALLRLVTSLTQRCMRGSMAKYSCGVLNASSAM